MPALILDILLFILAIFMIRQANRWRHQHPRTVIQTIGMVVLFVVGFWLGFAVLVAQVMTHA